MSRPDDANQVPPVFPPVAPPVPFEAPSSADRERPAPSTAERERLDAVRATGLVGVVGGDRLDRIARQAAMVAGTPMGLVSLVDEAGQWNPGVHGEGAPRQAPRSVSLCARAIETPGPFVVSDASKDPRWFDVPGVAGSPGVRFYAGHPIDDGHGNRLGVVCVMDVVPREADEQVLSALGDLANWARHELLATSVRTADDQAAPATAATGVHVDQATRDRLEELERLQSLVVSTTAHELRTPLTVLRVHAELLQMRADTMDASDRASLEAIVDAVSRLQDVSDGLVADLRTSAGGAEHALRRWLKLDEGSARVRPVSEPDEDDDADDDRD